MQKKYINAFLLIMVIIIWANVLIHIFNGSHQTIHQGKKNKTPLLQFYHKKHSFVLQELNHDPFLKRPNRTKKIKSNSEKKKVLKLKKIKKNKLETPLPQIKYFGYIKKEKNKDKLLLIQINHTLYKLKKGDEINGLKIVKIYTDSILFSFKHKKIVIKKSR